jgi:hypothetical protein
MNQRPCYSKRMSGSLYQAESYIYLTIIDRISCSNLYSIRFINQISSIYETPGLTVTNETYQDMNSHFAFF